jgi:hypothetical protein
MILDITGSQPEADVEFLPEENARVHVLRLSRKHVRGPADLAKRFQGVDAKVGSKTSV